MVLTLNGNETMSGNNMFGTFGTSTREDELKRKMIDKLLIPLFQKKWGQVRENFLLFGPRFRTLKDEMYHYLLKTIELLLHEHQINPDPVNPELVFILPPIRLKPEYEIYKLIFGIPKQYDKNKLERIRKLLNKENITFDKIKNQV